MIGMVDETIAAAKSKVDPKDVNPKLAALHLARELMNGKNPTVFVVNDEFAIGDSLIRPISEMFKVIEIDENGDRIEHNNTGLDGVVQVFDRFEEMSASIGGTGRQQVVECVVNSSRQVYQGFSPLAEDKGPGIIQRILAMAGRGNGGSQ